MKANKLMIFLGLLVSSAPGLSVPAHATELLLDAPVAVTSVWNTLPIEIRAFRDASDCNTWYWFPATFANVPGLHADHKINLYAPDFATGASGDTTYLTSDYDFSVSAAKPSAADLDALKTSIVSAIRVRTAQEAGLVPQPARPRYRNCAVSSPSQINLQMMLAQSISASATPGQRFVTNNIGAYAVVGNGNTDGSIPVFFNPYNPFTFHLSVDATHPDSEPHLSSDLTGAAPKDIGSILFEGKGLATQVDASLNVSGTITAAWVSQLVQTSHCTSHQSTSSFNAASLYSFALFGMNNSTMDCTIDQQWVTTLKGCTQDGEANCGVSHQMNFTYSMINRGFDKMIAVVCGNDDCSVKNQMPYKEWLRSQLLAYWLQNNFSFNVDQLNQLVIAPKGLPNGQLSVRINDTVHIQEDTVTPVRFSTDVLVSNIAPSDLSVNMLRSPVLSCAQSHYLQSVAQYRPKRGEIVPVSTGCTK